MPMSWEQKRAAIAAALAGGNPASVGAGPMVNPMMAAMAPAAPAAPGGADNRKVYSQGPMMDRQNALRTNAMQAVPADALASPLVPQLAGSAYAGSGGPRGGLMGSTPTQGQMMAAANASLQGAPGFDYVPPAVGPPPVAAPAAGAGIPWTRDDRMAFLRGRPTQANQLAYTQALGQGAYDYNRQGSGNGGYTTSGRHGSGSSSSARGGGFRGF